MNVSIKHLLQDRITSLTLLLTLSFCTLYGLLLGITFYKLPPLLPIFNQMPWGLPRIGTRAELFIPFAISLAIFIINAISAAYVYQRLPLVSRMLLLTSFLASFLALLYLLRTLLVTLF